MYCRVSTDSSDQLNSLKNQIEHYKEILASNKNYKSVSCGMLYSREKGPEKLNGIFADEGISGTKKKHREAFIHMLECAKNKQFDLIYIKNIARFARNVGQGANDLKLLKSYGIDVYFEDGNLLNSKDEAIINILLTMAQEESRAKSIAVQFGIRKAQKAGKWTSNCPYGYDRANGFLQINPKEAKVIKQIYKKYVDENWGQNKILRWLNNNNITTKNGGKWYQQHIKDILSNPLYTGIQTTHKSVNRDINITLVEDVDKEDWIVHNKKELQIIDSEMWELARDKFNKNTELYTKKHRDSSKNIFSAILYCGNCGGVMRRKKKKTKVHQQTVRTGEYEWVCQKNDLFGSNACKFRNSIDEKYLIKFCQESIQGYRENKSILEQRFKTYLKTYFKTDTKKLKKIKDEIEELKNTYKNRLRLNDKGILTDAELQEFVKDYRINLSRLEEEEHKLNNIEDEVEKAKRRYKSFINYLDKFNINDMENEQLKKIFAKIKVTTTDMSVYLKDGPCNTYDHDGYLTLNEIKNIPYSSYNESKKLLKNVEPEFMFMNKKEMDLFSDMIDNSTDTDNGNVDVDK